MKVVENKICTGKIMDMWSGDDYIESGKEILPMYQELKKSESKYVWYACYGSNMCKERFMCYINRCSDTTPPIEDKSFLFNHNIYFAKSAVSWQNGGKAFLDDSCVGSAYGRIYKVTKEQYEEIKRLEGVDYKKKVCLEEIDGVPVYTFTDRQKNIPIRTPSKDYFITILKGIRECYSGSLCEEEMVKYLIDIIFPGNIFLVVCAIRQSPHYISNAQICISTGLDLDAVKTAIVWLVEHGVIQQDRRSIRAGHRIDNAEAFFFTVEGPCARELVSAMLELVQDFQF